MKALPKRKGNVALFIFTARKNDASMKALPKRKGNPCSSSTALTVLRLNESPSQKEGKCQFRAALAVAAREPQ